MFAKYYLPPAKEKPHQEFKTVKFPQSILQGLPRSRPKGKRSRLALIREGKQEKHLLEKQEELDKLIKVLKKRTSADKEALQSEDKMIESSGIM